jgi:hypothetical protein
MFVGYNMVFDHLFPLHRAGWMVATAPIYSIIEAKTTAARDNIIEKWKEATLSTLTSVIYIVRTHFSLSAEHVFFKVSYMRSSHSRPRCSKALLTVIVRLLIVSRTVNASVPD